MFNELVNVQPLYAKYNTPMVSRFLGTMTSQIGLTQISTEIVIADQQFR